MSVQGSCWTSGGNPATCLRMPSASTESRSASQSTLPCETHFDALSPATSRSTNRPSTESTSRSQSVSPCMTGGTGVAVGVPTGVPLVVGVAVAVPSGVAVAVPSGVAVAVPFGVGLGVSVPGAVPVGVAVAVGGSYSYAPTSQIASWSPLPSIGRSTPRWSVVSQALTLGPAPATWRAMKSLPLSIAGLRGRERVRRR